LVKIHTRDSVRVLVFPSCQLGSGEREMIEEMVLTASAPIAGFEPKFMLFDLPFLFATTATRIGSATGPSARRWRLWSRTDQAVRVDGVGVPQRDYDPEAHRGRRTT
jgi:hypothetical protein